MAYLAAQGSDPGDQPMSCQVRSGRASLSPLLRVTRLRVGDCTPRIHAHPEPQHVTSFGHRVFADVISYNEVLDFPGGQWLRTWPANAEHWFEPWSEKIPNATRQT